MRSWCTSAQRILFLDVDEGWEVNKFLFNHTNLLIVHWFFLFVYLPPLPPLIVFCFLLIEQTVIKLNSQMSWSYHSDKKVKGQKHEWITDTSGNVTVSLNKERDAGK